MLAVSSITQSKFLTPTIFEFVYITIIEDSKMAAGKAPSIVRSHLPNYAFAF